MGKTFQLQKSYMELHITLLEHSEAVLIRTLDRTLTANGLHFLVNLASTGKGSKEGRGNRGLQSRINVQPKVGSVAPDALHPL